MNLEYLALGFTAIASIAATIIAAKRGLAYGWKRIPDILFLSFVLAIVTCVALGLVANALHAAGWLVTKKDGEYATTYPLFAMPVYWLTMLLGLMFRWFGGRRR